MSTFDLSSLDHVYDSIVITTAELDPPGPQIVYVNTPFTRMTGYSAADVLGKTPRLFQGPKTDRHVLDRLRERLGRGEETVLETINYGKDGREYTIEWRVSPIRDAGGRITHFFSIQRDVSERRRAQEALFQEKAGLRTKLDALGDAVFTTDPFSRIDYLNPSAEALTGWTAERACGRALTEVIELFSTAPEKVAFADQEPLGDLARQCLEERRTLEIRESFLRTPHRIAATQVRLVTAPIRPRPTEVSGVVLWLKTLVAPRRPRAVLDQAEAEIRDGVTGLLHRAEFERRLDQILRSAQERGTLHSVFFVQIEPEAEILTAAGGEGLDHFQMKLADSLRRTVRASDTLARLGEGHFGLILTHCPLDKAAEVAEAALEAVRGVSFVGRLRTFPITASVGLVPFTAEAADVEQLYERGREACATARALGGNQVQVFRSESGDLARRRHEVVRAAELLDALEDGRFELHGQPIVPLHSGSSLPVHYEILLRMRDLLGNVISPSSFILAAERFDVMTLLDRWVISTVLRRYHEIFDVLPVGISVNLSAKSLSDDTMLEFVLRELEASPIPSRRICFEITETAAISDLSRARQFITRLKRSGCRFALDDFGSGHSSFAYLKHLPVDYLKIDGTFVRDLREDSFDRSMVAAILQMGHGMGIRIVAEWVETDAVLKELRDLGVDYVQGWAIGRPQPLESFRIPVSA